MQFLSDNTAPASPQVLAALAQANHGYQRAYGCDDYTQRLDGAFSAYFGTAVRAFAVVTGTAANSLALATLTPPYGAVFASDAAHVLHDECGACELQSGGARLTPVPSRDGRIEPRALSALLAAHPVSVHGLQPAAVTIAQASECGTVYRPAQIAALAEVAHARGLKLHMDGSRFANALAHLGAAPAQLTWQSGVDVLSFGATKNGALGAEAVVFFDAALARDFELRRKRAGHLLSKLRYVSAQLLACLEGDFFLGNARAGQCACRAHRRRGRQPPALSGGGQPAVPALRGRGTRGTARAGVPVPRPRVPRRARGTARRLLGPAGGPRAGAVRGARRMELIDIGSNLTHESFRGDLDAVLARAVAAGVRRQIVTGTSLQATDAAIRLHEAHPALLFATAGIHPHHASDVDEAAMASLASLAASPAVVAIGECGLDYYRNYSPRDAQRRAFARQLELAATLRKPVFLHQRDAHADFLAMLREFRHGLVDAVAHCFTGQAGELEQYLELGLAIGITGWICDERRGLHLKEIVGRIPAGRLMLETDAPYLLPRNLRPRPPSRRNEPAYLPEVARCVALARDESPEQCARQRRAPPRRFFSLPRDHANIN